jgi:hypothetical protein
VCSGPYHFIAGTELHRKAPYDSKAQKKESEGGYVLPSEILFAIKFHDKFSDNENNRRINHCAQAETVHLEIGDKTSEQFNDHEKREDIDNYDVEGLADGPIEQKFLDFIEGLQKSHNKHNYNEQS